MSRYDEQHLREIMATIRAPEGLRDKRSATTPTVIPVSPARPPRPRWPLPVIVGAAAVGLMFGSFTVAQRLTVTTPPAGTVGSSISPPVQPSNPDGGPLPTVTAPGASASPGRTSGPPKNGTPSNQTVQPPSGVGVPAGATLAKVSGDYRVTTAGVTVSNIEVTGTIMVAAPNVTLQNVRVRPTDNSFFGIQQEQSGANLTIRDSEVIGNPNAPTEKGISQSAAGLTVSRVLIRDVDSGIHLGAGSVTVTNSRIDQLTSASPVGIGSNGDTPNLNFSNNTILVSKDAGGAIVLYTDSGPYQGVIIEGNVVAGGSQTLVAGQSANSNNIKITNNTFSRMYYPNCGSAGPVIAYDPAEPGNQWSGNVWADTGQAVDW